MDKNRITIDPNICHGKPCIAGHRIPVYMILELVAASIPFDEILHTYYPSITAQDIRACIEYARYVIEPEPLAANLTEAVA